MSENLLKSVFFLGTPEGRLGSKENIENNSTAPEVAFVSKIAFDNLRRHVADSAH